MVTRHGKLSAWSYVTTQERGGWDEKDQSKQDTCNPVVGRTPDTHVHTFSEATHSVVMNGWIGIGLHTNS